MLDLGSTQKIDNFEHALASFKQQIESGVVLHTAFVSMRTSERLDDLCAYRLDYNSHVTHDKLISLASTIEPKFNGWVSSCRLSSGH